MSSAPKPADLVTVNIDGKEIAVPKGTNVIEAAQLVGVEIPHYCYHPKLSIVGNCRMCLIEMGIQAGECKLQEHSTAYGRGYSRFIENKNVKPKRTVLGPRVTLDDERCILCSRCIRFSKEIAKDDVLGFIDRGSYSTLTCYP